jgi:hypothetical protein
VSGDRTTVTELTTGLGMLGLSSLDEALERRPPVMVSMAPEHWSHLAQLRAGGAFAADFDTAWSNGRAFFEAADGLRRRPPLTVEWKGSQKAPGDEVAPIDLRVDHVYLVSCKYESDLVLNASPTRLFDRLLAGPADERAGNWFLDVSPAEYRALYDAVRSPDLPERVEDLTTAQRLRLKEELHVLPHAEAEAAYAALAERASAASAARWRAALGSRKNEWERMLWRLLRVGSAPYFLLGRRKRAPLRVRVATAWDWRQRFAIKGFEIEAQAGGQPRVGWTSSVRDRHTGADIEVRGHIEVRPSHGRFTPPEAKVYLDTPHVDVPGYFPLRTAVS